MSIKVEGMGRVRAALLRVTGEAQRTASREVVRSALNIQTGAKQRLTSLGAVDTGRLRNSVAVAEQDPVLAANSDQATPTKRAPNAIRAGMLSAVVGTNVEYSRRIEFGFVGTDSLGRKFNQAARPYLFPSAEEERVKFHARMRAALGAALVRITD